MSFIFTKILRSCPGDYIRHTPCIHRHTGLSMASLNVLVKLLPSSPFRLFPFFLYWRSPLPFCLLFLFPSSSISWAMLSVSISLCNLDFGLPRVLHSVRSHIFSRSIFSVLFPFYLQYFLSYTLCCDCVCFQCFPCYYFGSRSRDFIQIHETSSAELSLLFINYKV